MIRLPEFHAAKWDEPLVMELGRPGGRGQNFPAPEPEVAEAAGDAPIPAALACTLATKRASTVAG